MESMCHRAFLIAGAGLLAASLAVAAIAHREKTAPFQLVVHEVEPDLQRLQADLDDLNARIATIVPSEEVPDHHVTREELRIAHARLAEVEARLDELRVRIAARSK